MESNDKIKIILEDNDIIQFKLDNKIEKVTPPIENLEVNPSKEEQNFKSKDYYGYDTVKVNPVTNEIDENIKSENIKKDINILGITGILEEKKEEQEKTISPTIETQEVLPDENKVFSKVTINPVTNSIDENIKADNIKKDISILGVTGNVEELNATEISVNPTSEEQTIVPEEPYNGFSKITIGAQSGIDPAEYFETTITSSNYQNFGLDKYIKKSPEVIVDSGCSTLRNSFNGCGFIKEIKISGDTSNVKDTTYMFKDCRLLSKIPLFNTSKVTNMQFMFYACNNLSDVIFGLDTSNVTNISNIFGSCYNLVTISSFNTSNIINFSSAFAYCYDLKTISVLDLQNATNINSMFNNCNDLANLGGLQNLGQSYLTTASANYSNYTLNLSSCNNLTHDSLMNVINGLYDIASKGCNVQKLQLGSTNLAKLTEEEIAIAQNKGWNVS